MYLITVKCPFYVQEEEKLIQGELASIKDQISSPNTSMVRLSYVSTLAFN